MSRAKAMVIVAAMALASTGGTKVWWEMAPVRLAVEPETLVVYVGRGENVPVDGYSRSGRRVYVQPTYEPASDDVFTSRRWHIECQRAGERDVTVAFKALTAPLHVSCREPVSLHGATAFDLLLGGDAPEVRMSVRLSDGRMVALTDDRISVDDTSIAVVQDGRLHPRRVGRTRLHVIAGIVSLVPVTVTERLAWDTLELRAGEFRRWPLPKGRYDISVRDLSGAARSFAELEMIGEGTRCVPNGRDRDLIHCLVTDTGVLVVQNRNATGAPRSPRTAITITRTQ